MKAIAYTEYRDYGVLRVQEVDKSVPKDNELVVLLQTAVVNFGDLMACNFKNTWLKELNIPLMLFFSVLFADTIFALLLNLKKQQQGK